MISAEMQFAIDCGQEMGGVMQDYFQRPDLGRSDKTDGSPVTEADLFISDAVVRLYEAVGRRVVSEERGRTGEYGDLYAEYLDPIDGTKDFEDGRLRDPRVSIAAFSLGSVEDGRFHRGVVNLPLLQTPRMYWAESEQGAYRRFPGEDDQSIRVDTTREEGVVLVSENDHPYIDFLDRQDGIRTVRLGGAVFKACAVADPSLIETQSGLLLPGEQVIGFLSDSASAHDYTAAAAITQQAGGVAWGLDGGALSLGKGKNGCVFANNQKVGRLLVAAMSRENN